MRERPLVAAPAAGVCAAASPVAGVLLALAALSYALARRAPTVLLALGAPVALVVLPVRALFPEGGYEPYPATSFAATAIVVGAFLWALPRGGSERRVLRVGAVVYLLACLLCLRVHSPMGSNIERYGVLLAGPLLLCGLAGGRRGVARWPGPASGRAAAAAVAVHDELAIRAPIGSCRVGVAAAGGRGGAVRDRGVDRVGAGARDAGGGRVAGDASVLLRAGRALPVRAWRRVGAGGGAADALALGGGDAGAERVAGAGVGEAAGGAL